MSCLGADPEERTDGERMLFAHDKLVGTRLFLK
jgi:hypothetical protein